MRNFALLAWVASVSAQMDMKAMIGNMSPQCQAAAGSLMTSEFASCSNLMGLVNILGATGSLLPPYNAWVDSICSMSPCSPSTVSTAVTTVQGGCQADATKGVPAALEMSMLVSNYATVRNALCLENKANRARCASELLATSEKAAGRPLTLMEVSGFLTSGVNSLAPALSKVPKEAVCTDCTHALISVLSATSSMPPMGGNSTMAGPAKHGKRAAGAPSAPSSLTSGAANLCGPSFADGKIPDTVATNNGSTPLAPGPPGDGAKNPAAGAAPNPASALAAPALSSLAILASAAVLSLFF